MATNEKAASVPTVKARSGSGPMGSPIELPRRKGPPQSHESVWPDSSRSTQTANNSQALSRQGHPAHR